MRITARLAATAPVVIVAVAAPAPAASAPLTVEITGGTRERVTVCGAERAATVVDVGAKARVVARGRGPVVLRIASCDGGAVRVAHRTSATLPTSRMGGLRITATLRRRGRASVARRRVHVLVADPVVETPLEFAVSNLNRSAVPCRADGAWYTVAGKLVAPRGPRPAAVTLLLHEYGWGAYYWRFPGRDFQRTLALGGRATLAVDRLGYGASGRPPGSGSCLGAQADIAHQIVGRLRAQGFERVAVAGHSGGGAIAELLAESFGGVDALALVAYSDSGFTPRSIAEATEQALTCLGGGEAANPGYARFAQTDAEWKALMFSTARPQDANAAARLRSADPCGDVVSLTPTVAANSLLSARIAVPVLLLYGTADAIYDQPAAGQQQRAQLTGSPDITLRFFPSAGHALALEEAAPEAAAAMAEWLSRRGF